MVRMHARRGFTLIELLVVVAIIALLIAILLPSISRARQVSARSACGANLQAMGRAIVMYGAESDDQSPKDILGLQQNGSASSTWIGQNTFLFRNSGDGMSGSEFRQPGRGLKDYLGGYASKIWLCPATGSTVSPYFMKTPSGATWWDPVTNSALATGAPSGKQRAASGYFMFFGDRGNLGKDNAIVDRYFEDAGYATAYPAFQYWRFKMKDYIPSDEWAQDIAVVQTAVGDIAVANHVRGGGSTQQEGVQVTDAWEYTPTRLIVGNQSQIDGQNVLRADGSVTFSQLKDLKQIYVKSGIGGANAMWVYNEARPSE